MLVDCQSHVFPIAYAEILTQNTGWIKTIRIGTDYRVSYGDFQSFTLTTSAYSLERKLTDMDKAGIDISVLSVNMPGPELLDSDLSIKGAQVCNDYIASLTELYPDRFAGLACLAWQDIPAALAELDRAIGKLDLKGVMLYSHIGCGPVDEPRYGPIYERIETLDVPIVLHPCVPKWGGEIQDNSMIPMVGLMCDQSFAMLRLMLSGVMERYPALKIIQPHCGGILPYLWGRIEHQAKVMGRGVDHISQSLSAFYDRVYLDTVSPSALTLRYAYDFQGADHLIFGSDHPWVEPSLLADMLRALEVPQVDKNKMLGGNAQDLFRLT